MPSSASDLDSPRCPSEAMDGYIPGGQKTKCVELASQHELLAENGGLPGDIRHEAQDFFIRNGGTQVDESPVLRMKKEYAKILLRSTHTNGQTWSKNSSTSSAIVSGCSIAAKWPPLVCRLNHTRFPVVAAQLFGIGAISFGFQEYPKGFRQNSCGSLCNM